MCLWDAEGFLESSCGADTVDAALAFLSDLGLNVMLGAKQAS